MKGLFLVPLYLPIDETSFMPLNLDEQLIFVFSFQIAEYRKRIWGAKNRKSQTQARNRQIKSGKLYVPFIWKKTTIMLIILAENKTLHVDALF